MANCRWLVHALAIAVFAVLLSSGVASAHAALARSDPAASATLPEPPAEIRLWFTEPLETTYTGADLLDASGALVPGVSVSIAPDNDRILVVTPPDLAVGGYTVAWRTLSAADGHTLQGYFGFQIGSGPAQTTIATAATSGNEQARALSRCVALLGLAALLAIAPVTLFVLDPARRRVPALDQTLPVYLRRYSLLAAALALLGSLVALLAQSTAIAPDASLPAAVTETLTETRYGQLWTLRVALLVLDFVAVAFAFWGRERWRRPALLAGTALALAMPVPFSLLSHASAQETGRASAVASDVLHLLAASVWVGGLSLLAQVLLPAMRELSGDARREALRSAIPRFSAIGLAAWGVLALSGIYAAWLQVGSFDALRQTAYGQTLLLKLALLLPILAFAAFHLSLGKRGGQAGGGNRFGATVRVEMLLVLVVVLVVGRLIGLEPAREVVANRTPSDIALPLSFATDEGARPSQLTIAPGAAGVNTFTLDVPGSPLPAGTEGVLRFELPNQDIGAQELRLPADGPHRFRAEGAELALAGDWQVTAIVRAIGDFAWETELGVAIGESPPPRLETNPAPRFAPAAIAGMVAMAIGIAGLAVVIAGIGKPVTRPATAASLAAVAFVAGVAIVAGSRMAAPVANAGTDRSGPIVVASPRSEDDHRDPMHHQATPRAHSATPVALPAPGTPVPGDGLTVTIAAKPDAAGPVNIVITLRADDGSPLAGARVVVLSEMPEMAMGSMETPARETQPGEYLAESVPLTMTGDWRVTVRISPRGASTQVFAFTVTVP